MIGDVPIRFSKRIRRKASISPIKACPKRKLRKSATKIRTCGVNSSSLKKTEKVIKGRKRKLNDISKQISKSLKQSSYKIDYHKRSRTNISKYGHKRKTRVSLNAHKSNLSIDEASLENSFLESSKEKKAVEKKSKRFLSNKKLLDQKSFKVCKLSQPSKEKGENKEITYSALKSSRERKASQKESSIQVTRVRSKTALSSNPEIISDLSKHSKRKKSARLSTIFTNKELSAHTSASKSILSTSVTKVRGTSKPVENKKIARVSKELNQSRIKNSEVSLCSTYLSQPLFYTPHHKKHPLKRKSSRLLEQSPLKTLNKELSLSTPVFLNGRNTDSFTKKSSKSNKYDQLLSFESHGKKQNPSKVINLGILKISHEKLKRNQRKQVSQHQKTSEHLKKLMNKTSNLPLDVLTTPALKSAYARTFSKKHLSKSVPKAPNRKSKAVSSCENHVCEELQDAKKRKSAGDIICMDDSTSLSKCRSMQKGPVKTDIRRLRKEGLQTPKINIQGKPAALRTKQPRRRVGSVPPQNKNGYLTTVSKRKKKSTGDCKKRKSAKKLIMSAKPPIVSKELFNNTNNIKKTLPVKVPPATTKKCNGMNLSNSLPIKEDCLTADLYAKKRRAKSVPSKNKLSDMQSFGNRDFQSLPGKGTLKRKRWLLNNLNDKNECYEDDIFENQNFNLYNSAFHFGDESDGGSSVNIATPKFDCILTPALPKKTPRFKDCISPAELLQARKSAEEYLFRRNKKRKSGKEPSSGKKSIMNKSKVQDIPGKKKLDFEETVDKLIEVQKSLEIQAEVGDEEEDSYFSDG